MKKLFIMLCAIVALTSCRTEAKYKIGDDVCLDSTKVKITYVQTFKGTGGGRGTNYYCLYTDKLGIMREINIYEISLKPCN